MLENVKVELNGLVVKPDEVLVVVLGEDATLMVVDEVSGALNDVGLGGRALVLRGDDIKLATVPRE